MCMPEGVATQWPEVDKLELANLLLKGTQHTAIHRRIPYFTG